MRATDLNGLTVTVYQVAHDVVRDALHNAYVRTTTTVDGSVWKSVDDANPVNVLTTRKCECDSGWMPGAFLSTEFEEIANVKRCDVCQRYDNDEHAARAFVAALNRSVERALFAFVLESAPDVDEDETIDDDSNTDLFPCVASASADATSLTRARLKTMLRELNVPRHDFI